jgi:ribonuclease HII
MNLEKSLAGDVFPCQGLLEFRNGLHSTITGQGVKNPGASDDRGLRLHHFPAWPYAHHGTHRRWRDLLGQDGMSDLLYHDLTWIKNHGGIIGVDECGRGPLAGPLVVAACYLDARIIYANWDLLAQADDSKKVSEAKRDALALKLMTSSDIPIVIVEASAQYVDTHNPLQATINAWKVACEALRSFRPGVILVDGGTTWPGGLTRKEAIVKGDATSCAIACASIVAKANRDAQMRALDVSDQAELGYNFNHSKHKGYGTVEHFEMLQRYGPSRHHRATFEPVKTLLARTPNPLS